MRPTSGQSSTESLRQLFCSIRDAGDQALAVLRDHPLFGRNNAQDHNTAARCINYRCRHVAGMLVVFMDDELLDVGDGPSCGRWNNSCRQESRQCLVIHVRHKRAAGRRSVDWNTRTDIADNSQLADAFFLEDHHHQVFFEHRELNGLICFIAQFLGNLAAIAQEIDMAAISHAEFEHSVAEKQCAPLSEEISQLAFPICAFSHPAFLTTVQYLK